MNRLWIEKGAYGPAVRRWQELLLRAGYDLSEYGADGGFGNETEAATTQAQKDMKAAGLYRGAIDCKVGNRTLKAMQRKLDKELVVPDSHQLMTLVDGVEVHDYRGKIDPPSNANLSKGNRWPKLRGVVLHRTACRLGERPERYFRVNAHMHVTRGGRIILCHPWDMHIWHGHRPSLFALGIEFDGNPAGYPGYWWKKGGGPDPITDEQVRAGEVLLQLLLDAFKDNGREFEYIYAHRQSSDQRECDPGWECWEKIAIPWMEQTGATPGDAGWQGTAFGTGYCIPQSWDPRSSVKRWRAR